MGRRGLGVAATVVGARDAAEDDEGGEAVGVEREGAVVERVEEEVIEDKEEVELDVETVVNGTEDESEEAELDEVTVGEEVEVDNVLDEVGGVSDAAVEGVKGGVGNDARGVWLPSRWAGDASSGNRLRRKMSAGVGMGPLILWIDVVGVRVGMREAGEEFGLTVVGVTALIRLLVGGELVASNECEGRDNRDDADDDDEEEEVEEEEEEEEEVGCLPVEEGGPRRLRLESAR